MFDNMRFTGAAKSGDDGFGGGAQNKLGSAFMRAMELGLDPFSVAALREGGFRALEGLLGSDGFRAAAPLPVNPDAQVAIDGAVVRVGMDALHGVAVAGQPLLRTWLPDFSTAGAVKKGECEMGPVAVALKATKAAAVLRNIKVR